MGPSPGFREAPLSGPAEAILGSCVDLLLGHRASAAMFQPFLCARGAVSLLNCFHTMSSPTNQKIQFSVFCPILSNKGVFFCFLPFYLLSYLPLFLLPPRPQFWLTFTRTQCDLVTLGILCTLICQFGKLICGRMSRSQRSGSWSADLLTG